MCGDGGYGELDEGGGYVIEGEGGGVWEGRGAGCVFGGRRLIWWSFCSEARRT